MPKRIDKKAYVARVLELDRDGLPVAEQARLLGLRLQTHKQRMARYGYRRHEPRGYWAPKAHEAAS